MRICVLALLFVPIFGYSQEKSPIDALADCSDPHQLSKFGHVISLAAHGDHAAAAQYDSMRADAKQCQENALEPAITSASKSTDLRTAVKDLYVKGMAYIEKAGQPGEIAAQRERDESWNRVRMELKLAK